MFAVILCLQLSDSGLLQVVVQKNVSNIGNKFSFTLKYFKLSL